MIRRAEVSIAYTSTEYHLNVNYSDWSTIPPISTKRTTTSHFKSLKTHTHTHPSLNCGPDNEGDVFATVKQKINKK